MTLARKQLQDIYDSGTKTLTDLQEQAVNTFKQVREEHAQNMQQLAEKSSQSMQNNFSNLQTDLKDLVHKNLDKLENVLRAENDQNELFVISLIAEMQARTEQMKSKLGALGQSHQENVDFASGTARQHYLSNLETAKINLDESAGQCTTGLTTYGNTVADKLLQTIDRAFWQQHEQSQKTSGSFFVTAREQEKAVTDHASSLTQTLAAGCQNRLATAKTLASQSNEEIESSIQSLLGTIAKHANHVEVEINDKYTNLTDSHFQKVDARLSEFADELSGLHDGVTDRLLKDTEELSTDLLSASTKAQNELRIKCDQKVGNVNSDYTAFKDRLEKRLQFSRGQKQTLEDDKNKILLAIKNELVSTHDSFAKKVAVLLADAKSALANMTKSVETKILTAMETCNKQIDVSATSTQKQIEDEVTTFLQELSNSRNAAVEEISSSAQGTLPLLNASSPVAAESLIAAELPESKQAPKRNRRRKDDDITENKELAD